MPGEPFAAYTFPGGGERFAAFRPGSLVLRQVPTERIRGGKADPKNKGGAAGGDPGGKPPPKASLPFDDDVAKDVWGHLPDKLRRQMTQYYKEDVMPKYAELLRLYYSSLSEGAPPVMPRK